MKILLVDDDLLLREGYKRALGSKLSIDTAPDAETALQLCERSGPYSVIVADMQMPGENGLQFLHKLKAQYPQSVRIMLTGEASIQVAAEAVNDGQVFRFLTKPCSPPSLEQTIREALDHWRANASQGAVLEQTLQGSIQMLLDIVPTLGPRVLEGSQKLAAYAKRFAQPLSISPEWELETSAMVSQIGLVHVPAGLLQRFLNKQGLSGADKDTLARVPEMGYNLISRIPQLERIANNVLYQNKNYDGTGFPLGKVAGEEIPICARVLRFVSDLLKWEASGLPKARAFKQMENQAQCYDPHIFKAAWNIFQIPAPGPTPSSPSLSAGASEEVLLLKMQELEPGDVLVSDLETDSGVVVVTAGTKLSPSLLHRIQKFRAWGPMKEPISVVRSG